MYFARRQEGDKSEMPHFAGQRGPEILRGLIEIEAVFDKNLSMLYEVKKTILDVKATTWHDDYNRFDIFDMSSFMLCHLVLVHDDYNRFDIFELSSFMLCHLRLEQLSLSIFVLCCCLQLPPAVYEPTVHIFFRSLFQVFLRCPLPLRLCMQRPL